MSTDLFSTIRPWAPATIPIPVADTAAAAFVSEEAMISGIRETISTWVRLAIRAPP